jgi:hypothetical protein
MARNFAGCLALAALALVAPACDQDTADSGEYVDGQAVATDNGAFTVTLFHDEGAPVVGDNTFFVRVAVVDSADPEDEGRGVPNLELDLAAAMTQNDYSMQSVPVFTYEEDGTYRVDAVLLDRTGSWNLDFDMEFGSIQEHVAFDFVVEG